MAAATGKPVPREWLGLAYEDPANVLAEFRERQVDGYFSSVEFRALTSTEKRQSRERRQAALLCFGLGQRYGLPVVFAMDESWNHDLVSRIYQPVNRYGFVPVQLKEVVPVALNPLASLQAELDKLEQRRKYVDTLVAFYFNQDVPEFRPADLQLPHGAAQEIWVFGAREAEQRNWWLLGNLLGEKPDLTEFTHPSA
jgi:hypothetical protein